MVTLITKNVKSLIKSINSLYKEKGKEITWKLLLTFGIYFFSEPLKILIYNHVDILFKHIPNEDTVRAISLIILICIAFGFVINNIRKKKYPSFSSILTVSLFLLIYLLVFRCDRRFDFIQLIPNVQYPSILDIIFFTVFIFFSNYVYKGKELEKKEALSLIEEDSSIEVNDLYLRRDYANEISKIINSTTSKNSTSIAILAEWGYGKTVFLNFIKEKLKEDKNNIILDFSPWKTEEISKSLHLFYEELENKVSEYDKNLGKQFREYFSKVVDPQDDGGEILNTLKMTINQLFFPPKSLNDRVKSINKALKRIGKRIVIFSDDWDRLSGEELMYLIRLIRNTSDFANTIFIAAFDRNYVLKSLAENKVVYNVENFLSKIFQLEVILPPIRKEQVIESKFKEFFDYKSKSQFEKEKIDEVLRELAPIKTEWTYSYIDRGILEEILENIRDILRFTNSFKIIYRLTYKEVVVRDMFLLELLKFKFPSFYSLLSEQLVIQRDFLGGDVWNIDEKFMGESFLKDLNIQTKQYGLLKIILKLLFNVGAAGAISNPNLQDRSIKYPKNHVLYFNYNLFNLISYDEFYTLKKQGFESLKEFIDNIKDEKHKLRNLLDIIDQEKIGATQEEIKIYWKSIMYLYKYVDSELLKLFVASFLNAEELIIKGIFKDNEANYNNFIESEILLNQEYDIKIRSEMAYLIFYEFMYGRNKIIFDKKRISEIYLKIFYEAIEGDINNFLFIEGLYQHNIQDIDFNSKELVLNKEAVTKYKDFIEKNPKMYLKHVIRHFGGNMYVFAPFIEHTFGNYNNFKKFLNKQEKSKCLEFIKEKFKEFEANKHQPIIIQNFKNINPCNENNNLEIHG